MILDIPKKMFRLHTVVHNGEGEESYTDLLAAIYANLPSYACVTGLDRSPKNSPRLFS